MFTKHVRYLFIFLFALCQFSMAASPEESKVVTFLEKEYKVRFSPNNSIVIFKSGAEKFEDLFCAIRQARKSIHLEYFNFRNDSISNALFSLLEQKSREGVEVRVLFDGFGNASNDRPLRPKHLRKIRRSGIEIFEFDPVRFPYINHVSHRDHRKIVVIDGLLAYIGGMNVADYYIKGKPELGGWHDLHMRVEGGVVDQLQRIFLITWNYWTRQTISGAQYYTGYKRSADYFEGLRPDTCSTRFHKTAGVVNRGPFSHRNIIHASFLQIINNAEKHIQIISPYFTLCNDIRRALRRAVKRGVRVEIMVSKNSDIPVSPRIVEHNVHRLMKAGADIYFFTNGFHHSKVMMIDDAYTFVGSANLDGRSLHFDFECNLFIHDIPTTNGFQRIFEHDKQQSFLLTPQTWKTRFSKSHRFQAWFFQWLSPFM